MGDILLHPQFAQYGERTDLWLLLQLLDVVICAFVSCPLL